MLKIREDIDLKELEKFGFWQDKNFTTYHRPIYKDYIQQYEKKEYILVLKNRVIVKAKLECIIDFNENIVNGYKTQTNRVNKYIKDLIQAGLVIKE